MRSATCPFLPPGVFPLVTRAAVLVFVLALVCDTADAQYIRRRGAFTRAGGQANYLNWNPDIRSSIALAQRTGKPLLFYDRGSSDNARSDLQNAQEFTFRDPLVQDLILSRFIPVRLMATSHSDQVRAELRAGTPYGMQLIAATPDGKPIRVISADTLTRRGALLDQLASTFARYRSEFYTDQVQPVLTAERPNPQEVRLALARIREFNIVDADRDVIALFDHPRLARALRNEIYDTLAVLSTKDAVEALFERAGGDRQALLALGRATPDAAEFLADQLDSADPQQTALAGEAISRVLRIANRRPKRFWINASPAVAEAEIDRLKDQVQTRVALWREGGGELR